MKKAIFLISILLLSGCEIHPVESRAPAHGSIDGEDFAKWYGDCNFEEHSEGTEKTKREIRIELGYSQKYLEKYLDSRKDSCARKLHRLLQQPGGYIGKGVVR